MTYAHLKKKKLQSLLTFDLGKSKSYGSLYNINLRKKSGRYSKFPFFPAVIRKMDKNDLKRHFFRGEETCEFFNKTGLICQRCFFLIWINKLNHQNIFQQSASEQSVIHYDTTTCLCTADLCVCVFVCVHACVCVHFPTTL